MRPSSPTPEVARTRGRVAALSRAVRNNERPSADLLDAKRDHRAARTYEFVRKAVAEAPPMTEAQCQRIADLLLAGGDAA